jgi:ABC-type multidrug transport system fused ATPase/permease subunit
MKNYFGEHIRYVAKYLRPHKTILVVSFFLAIASTAVSVVQPLFAKVIIDKVFLGKNYYLLITLTGLLIIFLIAGFLVKIANGYLYTQYSAKVLFKMREDLFRHLQRAPLAIFSQKKIGDIYSRIASDMADVQSFLTDTIPNLFFNFLGCLITALILLYLNWKMGLLTFSFLPIATYVVHKTRPKVQTLAAGVAENNAEIAHFIFEDISGTSVIRSFNAEELECRKLQEKQSKILKILLRYQVLGALTGASSMAYVIIGTLIVFVYGGTLVLQGALSLGSLVAFSIFQARLLGPLQGLLDGFLSMQKAKVAIDRVREIYAIAPPVMKEGAIVVADSQLKGDIVFNSVKFAYNEDEPILDGISFHILGGKITGLAGPSGVGKTTICHLIMRLFDPLAGCITLDGVDIRKCNLEWLRKQIAIVSQDTFLFHTTIRENIKFSKPEASDEEITEAAEAACIHEFIASLPEGYDTIVGDRGVRLSGGQKQRISIARSLLRAPRILLLDEATAFLEPSVEDRLKETIRYLMEGRTTLVISHRPSIFRNIDKLIVINNTKVIYEGEPSYFFNGKNSFLTFSQLIPEWSSQKTEMLNPKRNTF